MIKWNWNNNFQNEDEKICVNTLVPTQFDLLVTTIFLLLIKQCLIICAIFNTCIKFRMKLISIRKRCSKALNENKTEISISRKTHQTIFNVISNNGWQHPTGQFQFFCCHSSRIFLIWINCKWTNEKKNWEFTINLKVIVSFILVKRFNNLLFIIK